LGVSLLIDFGLQDISVSGHVSGVIVSDLNWSCLRIELTMLNQYNWYIIKNMELKLGAHVPTEIEWRIVQVLWCIKLNCTYTSNHDDANLVTCWCAIKILLSLTHNVLILIALKLHCALREE
jgi:hypothetical protein